MHKIYLGAIVIWILALSIGIPPLSAQTILTDCDDRALQNAILTGGVIEFKLNDDCVIPVSSRMRIADNITIRNIGIGTLTLDGQGERQLFNVSSQGILTLENITLTGGYAVGNFEFGGAIDASGVLNIINCILEDNIAEQGGAMFTTDAIVTIENTIFRNNTAQFGGAIGGTIDTFTITDSTFTDNRADIFGGALIFNDGEHTIRNSVFINNTASISAGAIFNDQGQMLIEGSYFAGNQSGEEDSDFSVAGAIFNYLADLTVTNSLFDNNRANLGGAIMIAGGDVLLVHTTFVQNDAVDSLYTLDDLFGEPILPAEVIIQASVFTGATCVAQESASFTDGGNNIAHDSVDCVGETLDPQLKLLFNGAYIPQNMAAEYGGTCLVEVDFFGNSRPMGQACTIGAIEIDDDGATIIPAEETPAP